MTKVISIAAQKGGVGKSTTALHLVHYIAQRGQRVLLIDCDTQGNASQCLVEGAGHDDGTSRLFLQKKPGFDVIVAAEGHELIGVIPADGALVDIERLPLGTEKTFRANVRRLGEGYEYVVIDTPPTMGFAMLAPLVASDYAFSPMAPEPYSFKGVRALSDRVEQIRTQYNPELRYLGLLVNRWNRRHKQQTEVVEALRESMGDYLIPFQIGERAAIASVAFTGEPVWQVRSGAGRVAAKEMRAALQWIVDRTTE